MHVSMRCEVFDKLAAQITFYLRVIPVSRVALSTTASVALMSRAPDSVRHLSALCLGGISIPTAGRGEIKLQITSLRSTKRMELKRVCRRFAETVMRVWGLHAFPRNCLDETNRKSQSSKVWALLGPLRPIDSAKRCEKSEPKIDLMNSEIMLPNGKNPSERSKRGEKGKIETTLAEGEMCAVAIRLTQME